MTNSTNSNSNSTTHANFVSGDNLVIKIGTSGSNIYNFSTSYNGSFNNNASSYIKWVRIYNVALTSTQVGNIYAGSYPL